MLDHLRVITRTPYGIANSWLLSWVCVMEGRSTIAIQKICIFKYFQFQTGYFFNIEIGHFFFWNFIPQFLVEKERDFFSCPSQSRANFFQIKIIENGGVKETKFKFLVLICMQHFLCQMPYLKPLLDYYTYFKWNYVSIISCLWDNRRNFMFELPM